MAKLEPDSIIFYIIRVAFTIGFVLVMIIIFFSFKVEIKNDSMERFVLETADSISNSPLTDYPSVFNPQILRATESQGNVELYSRSCLYGYSLKVESLASSPRCNTNPDCAGFCTNVCGTGECECAGFLNSISAGFAGSCQCKKSGVWHDNYEWEYGYKPSQPSAKIFSDFPAGINVNNNALPSKMTITAYDSFLARASCAAQKSYELKENYNISFSLSQVASNTVLKRTAAGATHVCLYSNNNPYDCRYMSDVPLTDATINLPDGKTSGIIAAYPLKRSATCDEIKSNPALIAGSTDNVETVLLCVEASS